ncbi:hypothetical protein R1flu_007834 [Riccia fluitans]|uniref:Uncharacterized protein n=1 Tax=Riccia fluitans TaxID=41844 RepID=A0ABD1Z0W2_9MARC
MGKICHYFPSLHHIPLWERIFITAAGRNPNKTCIIDTKADYWNPAYDNEDELIKYLSGYFVISSWPKEDGYEEEDGRPHGARPHKIRLDNTVGKLGHSRARNLGRARSGNQTRKNQEIGPWLGQKIGLDRVEKSGRSEPRFTADLGGIGPGWITRPKPNLMEPGLITQLSFG